MYDFGSFVHRRRSPDVFVLHVVIHNFVGDIACGRLEGIISRLDNLCHMLPAVLWSTECVIEKPTISCEQCSYLRKRLAIRSLRTATCLTHNPNSHTNCEESPELWFSDRLVDEDHIDKEIDYEHRAEHKRW